MLPDIKDFMVKFDFTYHGPPRHLPVALQRVRSELLREEVREYLRAVEGGSLADELDALVDLVYVALGNAYMHGFPFQEAWDRVHAANMQKVKGLSKRGLPHDVRKPEGWVAPDLEDLVYVTSWAEDAADSNDVRGKEDDNCL